MFSTTSNLRFGGGASSAFSPTAISCLRYGNESGNSAGVASARHGNAAARRKAHIAGSKARATSAMSGRSARITTQRSHSAIADPQERHDSEARPPPSPPIQSGAAAHVELHHKPICVPSSPPSPPSVKAGASHVIPDTMWAFPLRHRGIEYKTDRAICG
ncbi:hypothetical protein CH63R_07643 [Colletotrichum higginsianum IMI 349063]|uniref:Uncharacterized protein n=1 Tax=Colletotrichum higginsianum (strain IMI 349063) TaxID=759273 RepID=A0A1B7YAG8_COLHI|nr:hypothetical protein CH63R_07643 [Colletotrichum higginsianum IMI 349063]OBR08878.1 hypothetical protein CH63R_07643 [Colletotrichum higginsianum IMI 349063]